MKETNYIYACAVYTGAQSKLGLNLKNKPSKFGTAEKSLNKIVFVLLGVLLLEMAVLTFLHYYVDDLAVQREKDLASRSN